jgi:hypothetical protein
MDKKTELIVDVKLEPGDVYSPFLWSRQNLIRWVLVLSACWILYEMSPSWSLDVPFPEGNNRLLSLYLIVAGVTLASFLVPYLRVRAMFRKSHATRMPRRLTFGTEGFQIESDDARGDYKWSLFMRIIETRKLFLLFQTPHAATYIPKRCFRSADDVQLLRQLIRNNFKGKWTLRRD